MTPSNNDMNNNIGELKGLLVGIQNMMALQHESLNRRIDDLHHSTTRRLDDFTTAVNQRLSAQDTDIKSVREKADQALALAKGLEGKVDVMSRKSAKTGALTGGGVGVVVAGGIELAKALLSP